MTKFDTRNAIDAEFVELDRKGNELRRHRPAAKPTSGPSRGFVIPAVAGGLLDLGIGLILGRHL